MPIATQIHGKSKETPVWDTIDNNVQTIMATASPVEIGLVISLLMSNNEILKRIYK